MHIYMYIRKYTHMRIYTYADGREAAGVHCMSRRCLHVAGVGVEPLRRPVPRRRQRHRREATKRRTRRSIVRTQNRIAVVVLKAYSRRTRGVLKAYSRRTQGVLNQGVLIAYSRRIRGGLTGYSQVLSGYPRGALTHRKPPSASNQTLGGFLPPPPPEAANQPRTQSRRRCGRGRRLRRPRVARARRRDSCSFPPAATASRRSCRASERAER
jgi:hypothetical protein